MRKFIIPYRFFNLFLIFCSQICSYIFCSLVFMGTTAAAGAHDVPEEITIGVIPGGNPESIKKQGIELVSELQNVLNIKTNIYISKDYNTLIEAMKEKKIDFAFLTALSFVYAEKTAQAKVLLKNVWTEPFYFSALVTLKKNKINRFIDLKNKKIAFVDTKSTSGYLYPKAHLKKMNFLESDFKSVVYSGNHSQSVKMLEENSVDVIAVFSDNQKGTSGAWTKFAKNPKQFKTIWVSDPIPTDPFAVRQEFYDKFPNVTYSVMMGIIDIYEKSKNEKKFSDILGDKGLVPATSKQYEPVREVIKNLNMEIK